MDEGLNSDKLDRVMSQRMYSFCLFMVVIVAAIGGTLYYSQNRKPMTEVPGVRYQLSSGETVVEFNSLDGSHCVATAKAMTCRWAQ